MCECVRMGCGLKRTEEKGRGGRVCVHVCLEEVVLEFQLPTLPVPFLLFTCRGQKKRERVIFIVPLRNEDQKNEGDFEMDRL